MPLLHLHTEAQVYFFPVLPQTLSLAFLVDFSITANKPLRLPGIVYLVASKVGVTCTYTNKNEE